MTRDPQAILGIDLDITSLSAAVLDNDGEPRVLPNADGEDVTPACIHIFDTDGVAVGDEARRMLAIDRTGVVEDVAMHLGEEGWFVEAFSRQWTAQELTGIIMRKLREDVSDLRNMEYGTALVAVPAWFDSARRRAVYEACAIGEIEVGSLVNQPIAGALGAGIHTRDIDGDILLIDVGNRDTEIGLIEKDGDSISLKASTVDFRACVRSFEVRLRRHLLEHYKQAAGGHIPDDPRLAQQIYDGARLILSTLTTRPQAATRLQAGGTAVSATVDRPTLARVADDLIRQLDGSLAGFLGETGRDPRELAAVALIGPGARIPLLRDRFQARFRERFHDSHDPERCIARGAALLGALRHTPDHPGLRAPRKSLPQGPAPGRRPPARSGGVPQAANPFKARLGLADGGSPVERPASGSSLGGFRVKDATTQTLGLIALDRQRRERVVPLIQEGTSLPCEVRGRFTYAYTGMTAVRVEVTEGRGVLREDVNVVGAVELRGLPPRPVGTPIEIIYSYDTDQVLKVDVIDIETGVRRRVDINFRGGMSEAEIKKATKRATEIHWN